MWSKFTDLVLRSLSIWTRKYLYQDGTVHARIQERELVQKKKITHYLISRLHYDTKQKLKENNVNLTD